jgi:hypothetical protein
MYVVGVHRSAPGRRPQLLELLDRADPAAKVATSHTTLVHLEGGAWQFLTIERFNSWQDLATARAASTDQGWLEVRQNSATHTDTIADRISSTK